MTPYIMTLFMQNVDVEVHGVNTLHRDTLHHDTLHAERRCGGAWSRHPAS